MESRSWIFPTICFGLFCYAMVFVGIFTYHTNPNVSLFQSGGTQTHHVTDVESFQKELNKKIK